MPGPCFGIDLGTTASAIGRVVDGRPRLVSFDGSGLLPSVLLAHEDGDLVGQPALNTLPLRPERGIRSSKRLMGTEHRYDLGDRQLTPVDVAAAILGALVAGAEQELGQRPEHVVITVPAWFTQAQRADTRRAGELAGLQVVRIINEPTAAALAHAHGQDLRRRVLVYDLGGGTFDVSLVEQDGPLVEVRASHGDSHLGGDDIDEALVAMVLARLRDDDPNLHQAIEASAAARIRLSIAVEAAKIALSEHTETTLRVPFLLELDGRARHLELDLHRSEVDAAAAPLVARSLRSVDQVLEDAGVEPGQVDELLLVGGATLQPLVWHALHDRYGLQGSHAIAPRKAVALGAAIQGAIVDGSRTDGILVDVAPYSLSVGVVADMTGLGMGMTHHICRVLTPRNTPLPSRHSEVFYTGHRAQSALSLPIFQGSSTAPGRNVLIGELRMDGLPLAPAGRDDRPIRAEMRHDLDGMVHIEVTDVLSGRTVRGTVAADGEEQADLRRRYEEQAAEGLLDIWEEPEEDAPPPLELSMSTGPGPSLRTDDNDALRLLCDQVLAAADRLRAEVPELAPRLLDLARQGQAALAAGDVERCQDIHDELGDTLFEEGLYL